MRYPIWTVVTRSFLFGWERRADIWPAVAAVFIVSSVAGLIGRVWQADIPLGLQFVSAGFWKANALAWVASIVAAACAVGIHRLVLLGEMRPSLRFLRFDRSTVRYLGTVILLFLLYTLITLVVGLFGGILLVIGKLSGWSGSIPIMLLIVTLLAFGWLFVRLSLSLPAAAIREPAMFGLSWTATRKNTFRMLAALVIAFLPTLAFSVFVGLDAASDARHALELARQSGSVAINPVPSVLVTLIGAALRAVYVVVLATMLSLSFDLLVRRNVPDTNPAA